MTTSKKTGEATGASVEKVTEEGRQTVRAKKTTKKATKGKPNTTETTRKPRTIHLLVSKNPFDPKTKRHQKWKCLRDGATVSEMNTAMRERGLSSPRTFIANCQKLGHLEIK